YERLGRRGEDVEVVEIETGEVVLFWDTIPGDTAKLARALRADLAQLQADEFLNKWRRYEVRGRHGGRERTRGGARAARRRGGARVAAGDDAHPPLRGASAG